MLPVGRIDNLSILATGNFSTGSDHQAPRLCMVVGTDLDLLNKSIESSDGKCNVTCWYSKQNENLALVPLPWWSTLLVFAVVHISDDANVRHVFYNVTILQRD